jgi:ketosteroid isomerase-like protein
VEQFFRDWLGTWREFELETSEYLDAGDSVVVVFRQQGTGRESGIPMERDFFAIYELRESKVVRYRMYDSREEALEAAGLTE